MSELPEWVKPGVSFNVSSPLGDRLYHVRGIVDGHAVVRRWRKSKRYWNYEVFEPEWFAAFREMITVQKGAKV